MTSADELVLQLLIEKGIIDATIVEDARKKVAERNSAGNIDSDATVLEYLVVERKVTQQQIAEVLAEEFKPSKSQRKVLKKNEKTEFKVCDLEYRDEIFELYKKHSEVRFDQPVAKKEFIETHYFPSCPSFQTEYFIDGKLVAVGFIDQSSHGLSSVYFIYDTDYIYLSLGVYSILCEIELTKKLGLSYYYLGYWIKENKSMEYKNRYYPHETYDWIKEDWIRREKA